MANDSGAIRELLAQILRDSGFQTFTAKDGRDARQRLRANPVDLMLTDLAMEGEEGIELIRAIRREPRLAELPIIVVSYKDREEDRMAGMEAGASAYLTKSSFHDDSFIRMVEDLIGAPA